ncbi:GNAT family N-acetyltransferase [Aestuariibius sp. HNIBRBA575]|uniref:GNAT family N-acetyltransferase n=1 Tax=Aestuariibius sp. HNIBRBA575 TaxID=3233343 RepID=UPI0034A265DB
MKSLGLVTDLLVMTGFSVIEPQGTALVQRSVNEPNFWFGNRLILSDMSADPQDCLQMFQTAFPDAHHVTISWDQPQWTAQDIPDGFAKAGLTIDCEDILTLSNPLNRTNVPDGITIRAFEKTSDWDQSEDIQFDVMMDEGYSPDGTKDYLRKRSKTRRLQIADGLGQWFGAFEGEILVGDMGIFHDQNVIRYQSVQTHKSYRGRGICSVLLCKALDWAQARAPMATPVISAMADSVAGRLYRRAGFQHSENLISAFRGPL